MIAHSNAKLWTVRLIRIFHFFKKIFFLKECFRNIWISFCCDIVYNKYQFTTMYIKYLGSFFFLASIFYAEGLCILTSFWLHTHCGFPPAIGCSFEYMSLNHFMKLCITNLVAQLNCATCLWWTQPWSQVSCWSKQLFWRN